MSGQNVEKNVISTVQYFTFFKYTPNFDEIHTFYPRKIGKKALQDALNQMSKNGKIIARQGSSGTIRYTPRGYAKLFAENVGRAAITAQKIQSVETYIRLLKKFPQIRLIGLSGSVGALNAKQADDIDLFVITARNRIWTGRLVSLMLASLFGRRRKRAERHANNKICLNLFFQANGLKIPAQKRSYFVAHEVLKLKTRVDKNQTHRRLIEANSWIFEFFPNARSYLALDKSPVGSFNQKNSFIGNLFESFVKKIQLYWINRHRTTELILPDQLWFFPDDFEIKIPYNKLNVRSRRATTAKI